MASCDGSPNPGRNARRANNACANRNAAGCLADSIGLPTRFGLVSYLLQRFVCVASALVCPEEVSGISEAINSVKLPTLVFPPGNSKSSTVAATVEIC
jgi:hypothetical protein